MVPAAVLVPAIISALGHAGAAALSPRPQKYLPYGGRVGAQQSLEHVNDLTTNLFGRLANQGPVRLRSSFAQPVPGLTGVDPAYEDRSLLEQPHAFDSAPGESFPADYLGGRRPPPGSVATGQSMPRSNAASTPTRLPYGSTPTSTTSRTLDPQTQAAVNLALNHTSRRQPGL